MTREEIADAELLEHAQGQLEQVASEIAKGKLCTPSAVRVALQGLLNRIPDGAPPAEAVERESVSWPAPLGPDALHGLVGEVVSTLAPHTESDPAAIALQFLTAFGNCTGAAAHAVAEKDRHPGRLFVVLVGDSSKARKGSSWGQIRRLFEAVDSDWVKDRIIPGGLSSGEGLVHAVRDPLCIDKNGESIKVDPGVTDKRLLAVESEFASVLKMLDRTGNTLSPIVRQAWDGGSLRNLTKTSPASATDAHISMIGHITDAELRRYFQSTEAANGFGNRILWTAVRRSKSLPDGGCLDDRQLEGLARCVHAAVKHARVRGRLARTPAARALWHAEYERLSGGRPGLLGAVTSRAEAQVLRLSVLYAVLDRANAIDVPHLRAALDVWRYCEDSARWIFGDSLGDPTADDLLALLRSSSEPVARKAISDHFGRNKSRQEIDRALNLLASGGLAITKRQVTAGRPAETWEPTKETKKAAPPGASDPLFVSFVAPAYPGAGNGVAVDAPAPWEVDDAGGAS
ncbi:MAG: YfjI family protein [Myxococcota bacterium]|nr:YfjI family protein [Myxococcota bacterium]